MKNIVYVDIPNHYIYKKFQECNAWPPFLELFGQENKFET